MSARKLIILSICTLSYFSAFSQRKMDISLMSNKNRLNRYALEYRKKIKEETYGKISFSYRSRNRNFNILGHSEEIIAVNDSLITRRRSYTNSSLITLNIGFDKQIKKSIFSYGGSLGLGYLFYSKYFSNSYEHLSKNGEWTYGYHDESSSSTSNTSYTLQRYIVPSLQGSISMDAPVGKRFFIHLYISPFIEFNIQSGNNRTVDPFHELKNEKQRLIFANINSGFGIRYRLGKTEE